MAHLDAPPLIIKRDSDNIVGVPIERYNEMANHAWTFAGMIKMLDRALRESGK